MKYLIFNLKANLKYKDLDKYCTLLADYKKEMIIAPGYLFLDYFHHNGFNICSQDVSTKVRGNYTGEITSEQLMEIGCKYTIIGHYERYKYFNENLNTIIAKINQALKHKIKIILCFSEKINTYNFEEIKEQINSIYRNLKPNDLNDIIIAYEPSFLIGQQVNLDINKTKEIILQIKKFVQSTYNCEPEVMYGGGISLENLDNLKSLPIDGLLFGTLSTSINSILTVLQLLRQL